MSDNPSNFDPSKCANVLIGAYAIESAMSEAIDRNRKRKYLVREILDAVRRKIKCLNDEYGLALAVERAIKHGEAACVAKTVLGAVREK